MEGGGEVDGRVNGEGACNGDGGDGGDDVDLCCGDGSDEGDMAWVGVGVGYGWCCGGSGVVGSGVVGGGGGGGAVKSDVGAWAFGDWAGGLDAEGGLCV